MKRLEVRNLEVKYPTPSGTVAAVNDVSLEVDAGETLGLVGESGCGKSSLGKAIMRLVPLTAGQILCEGVDISTLSRRQMIPYRARMQMVFQDPGGSLNPRQTVGKIVGRPLDLAGWGRTARRQRVQELMQRVGLPADAVNRYPHEFSGGQRQRIGIARAMALNPGTIICDEPVSALDVSVRAQVINLLRDIQAELGISYVFISHDLGVVRHMSDRVVVMYLGRVVESGPTEALWNTPAHPYTRALLDSAPVADPAARKEGRVHLLEGELPSPLRPPPGCTFHNRCSRCQPRCMTDEPALRDLPDGRRVACHYDLLATDDANRNAVAAAAV